MEGASREDQKEENKEPTRKSSEIPTRRGDTSTECEACRISRPHPSSPRTSSVFSLVPFSPSFFVVLSCRDLPVRKPPLGGVLNATVGHACRRLRLYSHIGSSALSQNVLLPAPRRARCNVYRKKKITLCTCRAHLA